ncbi:GntR family transcriptional regulator [Poseidonocella sp. HB161398]|uniref:GntR family transcriptional regulator n=1 Tax=Poseidonocella sp. HB161398 TaxID=2320855 RepID=UPI0011099784|nr:GntR family transcriptional regulator [Poseidonocella sp. HB161398]
MTDTVENRIIHHVLDAIADQKLRAGTKLGEQELVAIFDCNRAQIRRALAMLTGYGVIELVRNRGAFVAIPSETESRQVFEARRAIEATICRNAVAHADAADLARMRAHLDEEARAAAGLASRAQVLRLSRRFHLLLAELGRNRVLAKYLEELTLRSALILGCYGSGRAQLCASTEHQDIVAAIAQGDADLACRLLEGHLRHLEEAVEYGRRPAAGNALASIFDGPSD